MIDGIGMSRFDDAKIIHHFGKMRQQLAHENAVLALGGKLEHRWSHDLLLAPCHGSDTLSVTYRRRQWLVELLVKIGLVIKQVQLTGSTRHEQKDHTLGPWGMVSGQTSGGFLTMDQMPQHRTSQPHGTPLEKTSPGLKLLPLNRRAHGTPFRDGRLGRWCFHHF